MYGLKRAEEEEYCLHCREVQFSKRSTDYNINIVFVDEKVGVVRNLKVNYLIERR